MTTDLRTNLPLQPTELIGRGRELAEAGALVQASRLVTLVGPGGIGKTSLALQLAADAVDRFEDGVFWVSLAAIRDPGLVEPTIAHAVGAQDGLHEHLRDKTALLLLDNFEHVATAATRLADLLGVAPRLKLLVTSREPLHLSGERRYVVPPLPEDAAVALFTERARSIQVEFEPDDAVAEICRRVDGLPLAIELAAARVTVLPPRQMLTRLEHRLDLLTVGARDIPERQRTLRSTLDWSHELLSSNEQELFTRLAVFAGGCTLAAAKSVCDGDLDTLQGLVDKSLVLRKGERFTMLETVREYALERLEAVPDANDQRHRHALFFLALAEAAAPEFDGSQQVEWSRRVEDEHDNLRAALQYFVRSEATYLELRLVSAVWNFWFDHGYWDETGRALEHALASSSDRTSDRVRALLGASWIAARVGDVQASKTFAEQSLNLSRELDDLILIGRSLRYLARPVELSGDLDRAADLYEESARISRASGDLQNAARVVNNLGMYPLEAGDYRGAAAMFEDALRMARESGDRRGAAVNLLNLGDAELGLAKYRLATGHLVESLKSAVELGFREVVVEALYGLAGVAGATGDHERFAMLVGAAQRAGDFGHVFEDFERQLYERGLEVARSRLGEERLADSIDAGRALTPEEAIEFAVALPPTGRDAARMLGPDSELAELSNRELDVLALTARGLSNEEIAKRLFLSVRTVERHHSNIYAKLRVSGKAARAAAAARYSRYETPET